MSKYISYQHVEKFQTSQTKNIEYGLCYIFPKIDGTNSLVYQDLESKHNINGICAGSRNRELSLEKDNAGFFEYISKQENIQKFLNDNPNIILYGEWLVKHTIKDYDVNAWRKFYVFDVVEYIDEETIKYLDYDTYSKLLDNYNIEYIPPICIVQNPMSAFLYEILEKNNYLMKDGSGPGEGIVIKNYNYKNPYGRVVWAKIVRNEFKAKNTKAFGPNIILQKDDIEQKIIDNVINKQLIDKEANKILLDQNPDYMVWDTKYIPRLLGVMFHVLITEELFDQIKKLKNPVVDFKKLNQLMIQKIRLTSPELF